MEYKPTSSSAIEFANANRLEEWIQLFLCGEGNNLSFSQGLKMQPRRYHAPKMTSLDDFNRDCGPEENMKWQIGTDGFYKQVNIIKARYEKGDWDMPPLIVRDYQQTYELNDGNHRYEALKLLGIKEYWVIFWEPFV